MTHFFRHPYLTSLAFHAVVWGAFYAVAHPIYLTNDDVAQWWMVSGKLHGWPASPYMVFSHYWLGWGLYRLYALNPEVPWYGLMLVGAVGAAFTIMGALLLRKWRWKGAALHGFVLATAGLWMMMHLQFTIAAVLLMGVAVIGWDETMTRREKALLAGLAILGFLIRPSAAAWMAPLALYLIFRQWIYHRSLNRRFILFLASVIALAGILGWIDYRYYARTPEWKRYREYNILRSAIHDFRMDRNPGILRQIGWDSIDHALFRRHFYFHPIFSLENLRKARLTDRISNKMSWERLTTYAILLWKDPRFAPAMQWAFGWLLVVALITLASWKDFFDLMGMLGFTYALVLLTTVMLKFPENRLVFPLVLLLGWDWTLQKGGALHRPKSVGKKLAYGLAFFVGIGTLRWIYHAEAAYRFRRHTLHHVMERLADSSHTYWITPDFPTPYVDPLHESALWQRLRIVPLGGMIAIPYIDSLLSACEIADPYQDLALPNARLVTTDTLLPLLIQRFVLERYDTCFRAEVVDTLPFPQPWWHFQVWRFRPCNQQKSLPTPSDGKAPDPMPDVGL